jgi:glyoxylase-like metal-dependent hydrolase (beta-lactamase superfamily II)
MMKAEVLRMDTLVKLTDNVWIFPRDADPVRALSQPNVGIVVTGKHTILVDAGNSPRHGRRIMIALDDIQAPSVYNIIYTHTHWDHVFGAMVFGAPAVAHELGQRQLAEMATRPWSNNYIMEEIQRSPAREASLRAMMRAVEEWRNFRIVQPELVLTKNMSMYIDNFTFEIEHVGGNHAPDSVVVRVPQAKVMFVGDCFYPPPLHLRNPGDTFNFAMMRSLIRDDYDWYIDGHTEPMTREQFAQIATSETLPTESL